MKARDDQTSIQQAEQVASDAIEFDEATGIYLTHFDFYQRPPSEAVIHTIAEAARRDPVDVPSLYQIIDLDALDMLFAPTYSSVAREDGCVTFRFEGFTVAVHSYGIVKVQLANAHERSS